MNHVTSFAKSAGAALFFSIIALLPAKSAVAELRLLYSGVSHGRLVFTYFLAEQRDIYVLDFDKGQAYPLVKTPGGDDYPVFSPDGSRVAFTSDVSGDKEVYVVNTDGSDLKRLTNSPGVDQEPDWSPDGELIAFTSGRLNSGLNIFLMDSNGGAQRAVTNLKNRNKTPRWSPRGDAILFESDKDWPGWDLVMMEMSNSRMQALTSGGENFIRQTWRPDGSAIAFTHGSGNQMDISLVNKGEISGSRIVKAPVREFDPAFTDDGSKLFYVAESEPGATDFQIFVLELDSKQIKQVTSGQGAIRHLSWSPYPQPGGIPQPAGTNLEKVKRANAKEDGL